MNNLILFIRNQIRKILFEDYRYQYNKSAFSPPSDVIGTARRALEVVEKNTLLSHGGNEGTGIQKAKALSAGEGLTHEQLKRMKAFYDKNSEAVKKERMAGKNIHSSELIQKWELWGGDAGLRWVNHEITTTQTTNQISKKLRPKGTKRLMDPNNTRTHSANHFFTENTNNSKPNIFTHTIYRIPTKDELLKLNEYNLTSDDIVNGFGYTIIGRGILSTENKNMIIESINFLCELFPHNQTYKEALSKAQTKFKI